MGGAFSSAGGVAANNIASWDGSSWAPLGWGIFNGTVLALAVYDDGSGDALYAAGSFWSPVPTQGHISKWDGATWTTLGAGVSNTVYALAVWDDGSGPALYAGGDFVAAGGAPASRIAKWNGTNWMPLSGGLNNRVSALEVHTDASGTALYAGGYFSKADGQPASGIARWDGSLWKPVGAGTAQSTALFPSVLALKSLPGSPTPMLYIGGGFQLAGGQSASNIASWDGSIFAPVGTGTDGVVLALSSHDDGSGLALYAGGNFGSAGGLSTGSAARWDGTAWSALPSAPTGVVRGLASVSGGTAAGLYALGSFQTAGGIAALRAARWDGSSFGPLGPGGIGGAVRAIRTFDDGNGPAVYVGGSFVSVAGQPIAHFVRWRNGAWSAVGEPLDGPVLALEVLDSGSGRALYVGGSFGKAGALDANGLAAWDGTAWTNFGSGLELGIGPSSGPGTVRAIAMHDDGTGPAVYVGGQFNFAGGVLSNHVARWNGSAWGALPTPMPLGVLQVNSLAVADLGSGLELVAGNRAANPTQGISNAALRWNGSVWLPVGSGLSSTGAAFVAVEALEVFDDGGGAALHAGGSFQLSGGQSVRHLARWNGAAWEQVGGGVDGHVRALGVVDDGTGPALFMGGDFTWVGQPPLLARGVARWDGAVWASMAQSALSPVFAIGAQQEFDGPAVLIGGEFAASPGGDSYLARWKACGLGALLSVPGCFANRVQLQTLSAGLVQGEFAHFASSSEQGDGVGVLLAGLPSVSGNGCGLAVAGLGEVLLSLAGPLSVGTTPTVNGVAAFRVHVSVRPALVGLDVGFQSAHVATSLPGQPVTLSNGLVGRILP